MTFPLLQLWSFKSSNSKPLMFLKRQRLSGVARISLLKLLGSANLRSRPTGQTGRFDWQKILTTLTLFWQNVA